MVVVLAEEMAKRSPESLFFCLWGEAALIRWDNVGGEREGDEGVEGAEVQKIDNQFSA